MKISRVISGNIFGFSVPPPDGSCLSRLRGNSEIAAVKKQCYLFDLFLVSRSSSPGFHISDLVLALPAFYMSYVVLRVYSVHSVQNLLCNQVFLTLLKPQWRNMAN